MADQETLEDALHITSVPSRLIQEIWVYKHLCCMLFAVLDFLIS